MVNLVNCTIASLKKTTGYPGYLSSNTCWTPWPGGTNLYISQLEAHMRLLLVTIGEILLACCSIQAMSPGYVPITSPSALMHSPKRNQKQQKFKWVAKWSHIFFFLYFLYKKYPKGWFRFFFQIAQATCWLQHAREGIEGKLEGCRSKPDSDKMDVCKH